MEGIDLVLAAELQQGQRRLAASPSPERLVTVGRLRSGVWSRAALLHRQNKKKGMPCLDKSKTYPVSPYLPASTWPAWLSDIANGLSDLLNIRPAPGARNNEVPCACMCMWYVHGAYQRIMRGYLHLLGFLAFLFSECQRP